MARTWMVTVLITLVTIVNAQVFTYQGFLNDGSAPANGNYDFRFRLYSDPDGSNQVGSALFRANVAVQKGLFTVQLDFGNVWTGEPRYLEISVRRAGTGSYTVLSPLVMITYTPYAIFARQAQSAQQVPWSGITGIPPGFADGIDNDTTYTAGAGLTLTGTTFRIADGGVVSDMLANGAVTTSKLADGAVTSAKLSTTGVTPGTYGDATQVGVFTVDAQGRITSASSVPISGVPPAGSAGGDLAGSYPNPTVAKIQGQPVSNTPPSTGQVLKWNGTQWTPDSEVWQQRLFPERRDLFYTSGYVGIGTNDPTEPLRVVSNIGRAVVVENYGGGGSSSPPVASFIQHNPNSGAAVYGYVASGSAPAGRFITAQGNTAVWAQASAREGGNACVEAYSFSPTGIGVRGWATSSDNSRSYGVSGQSNSVQGVGVAGFARMYGVFGYGYNLSGQGESYGVFGQVENTNPSAIAVYALGRLVASGTKSFRIDHPLMPETHYLYHFCTEGPEPMNAYSGNVTTDAQGYATVVLPAYFESINRDFRYQLTVIDNSEDFIQVKVVREIQNNQFVIRTSKPHVKVSWRVEAVRNDLWVQRYGYQTEQEKPKEYQGKYIYPELYGQSKERGIFYYPEPDHTPQIEKP